MLQHQEYSNYEPSWTFIALHSTLCSLYLHFHLFMVCFYLTQSSNKFYTPQGLELACFPLSFYCQCLVWAWHMMQPWRPLYLLKTSRGGWGCYIAGKEGQQGPGHGRLCTDTEFRLLTLSNGNLLMGFKQVINMVRFL